MGRLLSGFKRGLWLTIVAGIIFSVVSWGWNLLDGILGMFGISKWIAIVLLPIVLTVIGIISDSAFIPWLSARFQSAVTSSMMRRFVRDEGISIDPSTWTGKEVAVASGGDGHGMGSCYCGSSIPDIRKFGIVTSTFTEDGHIFVNVQFIYPPTGTGEVMTIRQDSCRIRLTGRSAVDHMATVSSFGRVRSKPKAEIATPNKNISKSSAATE